MSHTALPRAAERADYYRKTLEKERLDRERTDKDTIELLFNIKQRYNTKLETYMGKKSKQTGGDAGASWADDATAGQEDWGTSNGNDDWGNHETSKDSGSKKDNIAREKNENTQEPSNTNSETNMGKQAKKSDEGASWADNATAGQEDWGNGDWSINEASKDSGSKKDDIAQENTQARNNKTGRKQAKKSKQTGGDGGASSPVCSKDSCSKKDNLKEQIESTQEPTDDKSDNSSKEFREMKSNLWTARLDLRLAEREKSKLTEEVSSLKTERDSLLKKLNTVNQDHDELKFKHRGLTIDLCAANEEIDRLNRMIEELEADRQSRDRDVSQIESKRRNLENRHKTYQTQIADLESKISLLKDEKAHCERNASDLKRRNDRLETDLVHCKNLIRTLKDGCALVEDQAKTFEVRHDTVVMSKEDLERELISIKEESSRHITAINKLQKCNEQISKAFVISTEAHDTCSKELERLKRELGNKIESIETDNTRLREANSQLRKLIEYLQKNKSKR